MSSNRGSRRPVILFLSGFVVLLLVLAVIPQAFNLNPLWGSPAQQTTLLLWALTSLNVILLISCSLILLRNLLKLYLERRSQQLGSKFRTKLVFAFLGLSFIPVIFMSFFAYFLLNRAVDKWFSEPINRVLGNAEKLVDQARHDSVSNAIQGAKYLADDAVVRSLFTSQTETQISELASLCLDFDISMVLFLDKEDRPLYLFKEGQLYPENHPDFRRVTKELDLVRWDGEKAELTSTITQAVFGHRDPKRATITSLDEDGRDILLAGNTV